MKYRKLRIAWSVGCGIVCLLLIALWVRSYWWHNSITYRNGTHIYGAGARQAGIAFERNLNTDPRGWRIGNTPVNQNYRRRPSFYVVDHPSAVGVGMPLWFPVILAATFAAVPWIKWSRRFTLRTLLIGMTLLAVGLGVAVMILRGS